MLGFHLLLHALSLDLIYLRAEDICSYTPRLDGMAAALELALR